MKNVQNITLIFAALLMTIVSCKKNEDTPAPVSSSTSSKSRIYKVSSPGSTSLYLLFTYDDNNRISQMNYDGGKTQYFYDANGRVEKYRDVQDDVDIPFETIIKYQSGTEIDYRNTYVALPFQENLLVDSAVYQYQQGRVSKITRFTYDDLDFTSGDSFEDSRDTLYYEYSYDSRGNVTKEVVISGDGKETTEYIYDDKINYWGEATSAAWDPNLGPKNVNNILSKTHTGTDGQIDNSESYTVSYTYNSNGYPVKGSFSWLNGTKADYTMEYK